MIAVVVAILCVGFAVWLIQQLPIAEPFKKIAIGVMIFVCILWLLQVFGFIGPWDYPRLR